MSRAAAELACSLFGAALVAGCGPPHTDLSAPPPNAPSSVRVEAYEELRPRSPLEVESGLKGGIPESVLRTTDKLQLAGGAQVYYAEDLKPVLPADSYAYREAQRASASTTTATILDVAGVVLLVAGAVTLATPFLATSGDEDVSLTPIYIGTGVAVLSLPVFLMSGAQRRASKDAKANTFEAYEPALRRRLDLCEEGATVAPCNAPQRSGPP